MKDLMAKGYDKETDLYCKDITSHYHYKASCILPLDHKILDGLQIFLSFVYPNKAAQTVTPPAHCQIVLPNNHARNVLDNLYMRYQLFH